MNVEQEQYEYRWAVATTLESLKFHTLEDGAGFGYVVTQLNPDTRDKIAHLLDLLYGEEYQVTCKSDLLCMSNDNSVRLFKYGDYVSFPWNWAHGKMNIRYAPYRNVPTLTFGDRRKVLFDLRDFEKGALSIPIRVANDPVDADTPIWDEP